MVYQYRQKQKLKIGLDEAWAFFSSPENLAEITPPDLNFQIINGKPKPMYAGQIIEYKVHPLFNFPMTWLTEITQVQEHLFFIDAQRVGPYKLWHHQHHFHATDDGIEMEDIVTYQLPLGFIGRFAHWLFVKKRIEKIFEYRKNYLDIKFNQSPS